MHIIYSELRRLTFQESDTGFEIVSHFSFLGACRNLFLLLYANDLCVSNVSLFLTSD
jgi:hypothetical protein